MKDIQYKELQIGSWDCRLIFAMGGTPEDAEQLTEKMFESGNDQITNNTETIAGEMGAFHYFEGFKGGTLWIENMPETPQTIAILGHEVTHASNHILGMSGVVIDSVNMNDEPQAYLVQHLMSDFLNWAWRINSEKSEENA